MQVFLNFGLNIGPEALNRLADYCSTEFEEDTDTHNKIEKFCASVAKETRGSMIQLVDVERAIQRNETGGELALEDIVRLNEGRWSVRFDQASSQFVVESGEREHGCLTLYKKVNYVIKRFSLVQEICKRELTGLTTIRRLCSSVGSERVAVTGLLAQTPEGDWILESDGGVLKIIIEKDSPPPVVMTKGFLYEGCVVVARGVHNSGSLVLESIAQPPLQTREASEQMIREHYRIVSPGNSQSGVVVDISKSYQNNIRTRNTYSQSQDVTEEIESPLFLDPDKMSRVESALIKVGRGIAVVMADVRLDVERGRATLRKMFEGFEGAGMHLDCVVLIGPFIDATSLTGTTETGEKRLKRAFEALRDIINAFSSFLSRTRIFIMPSPKDPVVLPGVIPTGPFPQEAKGVFDGKKKNIITSFSPAQIELFGRHFVFYDAPDICQKMSATPFPISTPKVEGELATFEYLTETLLAQRSLHPFLPETSPVRWDMDAYLSLFPTPDVLVVSGSQTPLILEGKTWAVSPGSFTGRGEFVVCYVKTGSIRCEASRIAIK